MIPQSIEEVQSQNIFDSPHEPEQPHTKSKVVVKKKKKKKKVSQYQNEDDRFRPQLKSFKMPQKVGHQVGIYLDGRTYQEIIQQQKKPQRMPPSLPPQESQKLELKELDKQQQNYSLAYHSKRKQPINTTKKRKQLFYNEQQDDLQQDLDPLLAQEHQKKKKKKERLMLKAKSHAFQDKLMKFLKEKYRQQSEKQEKQVFEEVQEGAQANRVI